MHWAEINATVGQLVVGYEQDGLDVGDLLALVERLETEHGTDADDFPGGRPLAPYDTAPTALARMALVSDCVGIAFAAAREMKPLTMLPLPVVVTESQPRLRRLLESRLGKHQAETAISLAGAAAHALAHGVAPLALDACRHLRQLAEFKGRQEVWARRERELVGDGERMPAHLTPRPVRPVPLPDGEVEKYAERTSAAAVLVAEVGGGLRVEVEAAGPAPPPPSAGQGAGPPSAPGRCWPGPGTPPSRRRPCWAHRQGDRYPGAAVLAECRDKNLIDRRYSALRHTAHPTPG
ncbi:hypothetical protein ACPCK9_08445 [Streptomyces koyangensis]|uniref:hypothetical protein n=1 Tax=Streptomyces koyangensis TaxID=188770 RepID=UPI003C2E72BF